MKKHQTLGITLIAIFMLSMIVAATASAQIVFLLAELLVNGAAVTSTLPIKTEGELLFENTKAPVVGKEMTLCSYIEDGTIGANGAGEIVEILSLAGAAISKTVLSGTGLSCTDQENCESDKQWATNLPWKTELNLVEINGVPFFGILFLKKAGVTGNPGWYVECTVLGVKASEECTAEPGIAMATNITAGVEIAFTEKFTEEAGLKLGECTGNKEETGVAEGPATMTTTESGTTLSVSSTG